MNIKQKFGLRIKELRKNENLSQESLAFKADLDRTYINSIENGRRNVSIQNINNIAKALNISLSELFQNESFNS
jgi:transcriptional regulator with XRE-family HTH domain|tara:strand:- start:232 stop:453 length:222 start_codon:yes stop_codon:yes gene_type:complete